MLKSQNSADALKMVEADGMNLEKIPPQFRTHELCLTAIKQNPLVLEFVPVPKEDSLLSIDQYVDICLKAAEKNINALSKIPQPGKGLSKMVYIHIFLAATKKNYQALGFFPKENYLLSNYYEEDVRLCLTAMNQDKEKAQGIVPRKFCQTQDNFFNKILRFKDELNKYPPEVKEELCLDKLYKGLNDDEDIFQLFKKNIEWRNINLMMAANMLYLAGIPDSYKNINMYKKVFLEIDPEDRYYFCTLLLEETNSPELILELLESSESKETYTEICIKLAEEWGVFIVNNIANYIVNYIKPNAVLEDIEYSSILALDKILKKYPSALAYIAKDNKDKLNSFFQELITTNSKNLFYIPAPFLTSEMIERALNGKTEEERKRFCVDIVSEDISSLLILQKSLGANYPELLLALVEEDPSFLEIITDAQLEKKDRPFRLPSKLSSEDYRNICKAAVSKNGEALEFIPSCKKALDKKLFNQKEEYIEICIAAVKNNLAALQFVRKKLPKKEDFIEIFKAAVESNGEALQFLDEVNLSPEDYIKICKTAVQNNPSAWSFVKEEALWEVVAQFKEEELAIHKPKLLNAILDMVKKNYNLFWNVPLPIENPCVSKEDYIEIILAAAQKNESVLEIFEDKLKALTADDYIDICVAVVKKNPLAFEYINKNMIDRVIDKLPADFFLYFDNIKYLPSKKIDKFLLGLEHVVIFSDRDKNDKEITDGFEVYAKHPKRIGKAIHVYTSSRDMLFDRLRELKDKTENNKPISMVLIGHFVHRDLAADSLLADMDLGDIVDCFKERYKLVEMYSLDNSKLNDKIIEFQCNEYDGFSYRVRFDGKVVRRTIPWENFKDFPENNDAILANKEKYLPLILKQISKDIADNCDPNYDFEKNLKENKFLNRVVLMGCYTAQATKFTQEIETGKKLKDEILKNVSPGKYDLAVMSKDEKVKEKTIEFDCTNVGLAYRVLVYGKEVSGTIRREHLPPDFPKNNEAILENKEKLLSILREKAKKHIFPEQCAFILTPSMPTDLNQFNTNPSSDKYAAAYFLIPHPEELYSLIYIEKDTLRSITFKLNKEQALEIYRIIKTGASSNLIITKTITSLLNEKQRTQIEVLLNIDKYDLETTGPKDKNVKKLFSFFNKEKVTIYDPEYQNVQDSFLKRIAEAIDGAGLSWDVYVKGLLGIGTSDPKFGKVIVTETKVQGMGGINRSELKEQRVSAIIEIVGNVVEKRELKTKKQIEEGQETKTDEKSCEIRVPGKI